ncbi:MAG TPA: MnhB domain-containing protein [Verrucomicrobiota bacterium]|nr:Na(+)/H(+) antiporter subunit B [Verrucomicrobiales bacterium]HRI11859.1 MnhB domain-containing protein [Verrucomicrobiota bacterium]
MKSGNDAILKTVAAGAFFVVNVFALYLLLRGHNLPGGGFIAGLATAASLVLLLLAYGVEGKDRVLPVEPLTLAASGVLLAIGSCVAPVLFGHPFLEQFNTYVQVPILGEIPLGTPLAFDSGVFLLVVGITTQLVGTLARSTLAGRALSPEEQKRYASTVESPIEDDAPAGLDAPPQTPDR